MFNKVTFDPLKIYELLKTKAYLVKGSNLHWECDPKLLKNKSIPKKDKFYFINGIKDYLNQIARNKKRLFEKHYYDEIKFENGSTKIELAINFNEDEDNELKSFCNSIQTNQGGTHETALKSSIMKSLKFFANHNKIKKISNISQQDVFEYSDMIISLYVNNPTFEGQTKQRLSMPDLQKLLEKQITESFSIWLSTNKNLSKKLIDKLVERSLLRLSLTNIKDLERKSASEKYLLPSKLVDCSSKTVENTELFIVEGDSAGGSAKQARKRENQAILPLRGKILNVYNVSITKIANNQEIQNLIQSLGCGIGKSFDINKLRYEKIILMTDADVDGSHIAALLITFFYKLLPKVIEQGKLFIAIPPLYKIVKDNKIVYGYNEKDKNNKIKKFFKKNEKLTITRFKGLGEMPSEQLKNTTMDQNNRNLLKIIINKKKNEIKKTEILISSLMGRNPELKLKFIKEKANFVNTLDV